MDDEPTTAAEAVRWELEHLWYDLHQARQFAIQPGAWSIKCDRLAARIVTLTRIAGQPTDWEAVQVSLLLDGVYDRLVRQAGWEPHWDRERAERVGRSRAYKRPPLEHR